MSQHIEHPSLRVEYATTPDTYIAEPNDGWTMRPCPPPGGGWVICDASSNKRTKWRRVLLVDLSGFSVWGGQR